MKKSELIALIRESISNILQESYVPSMSKDELLKKIRSNITKISKNQPDSVVIETLEMLVSDTNDYINDLTKYLKNKNETIGKRLIAIQNMFYKLASIGKGVETSWSDSYTIKSSKINDIAMRLDIENGNIVIGVDEAIEEINNKCSELDTQEIIESLDALIYRLSEVADAWNEDVKLIKKK